MVYSYSFAELNDRLGICLLKLAACTAPDASLEQEIKGIQTDLDEHLKAIPVNAEQLKGITVLNHVNKFIFDNETYVRDADDNGNVEDAVLLAKLKESHKANSLRAAAKKHIQNQRGERVDLKLNYGKENNFWNIKF